MAISTLNSSLKIVDESLKPTKIFFRILSEIISFINNDPKILDFAGNPENNITGRFKDQCWDTVNNKLYFKSTASGDTGWVAIN